MDRRTILAVALVMLVIIVPALLMPSRAKQPLGAAADSIAALRDSGIIDPGAGVPVAGRGDTARADAPRDVPIEPAVRATQGDSAPERTVTVASGLYRYVFSTRGARLVAAYPLEYGSLVRGDSGPAQLIPENSEFLAYRVVLGNDTISLADWSFTPSDTTITVGTDATLEWTGRRGGAEARLSYTFTPDDFLFRVRGEFRGVGREGGLVLVGLGPGLRSAELDTILDHRAVGVVTKAAKTENLSVSSLDPGERRVLSGPFEWVAIKSKYFVASVFTVDEGESRLGGVVTVAGERTGKVQTLVHVTASLPAPGGRFTHEVYVGPQEFRRLARIQHDFEDVNPYGWILRPIIRPFAVFIVRILLWMHETMRLSYGMALIVFGILVRVVLWPLNQKAMRSSTALQALQPEMKAIQDRYKDDPAKLQQEMMKLYKEHKVNPLGGCLPMLIPMPVLFALFFVFANTIEFRGEPFLWLPDLSSADPLYIIPIVMGVSMYGVSKIGQMGIPPNPQAKMFLYVMPIMFTVLFLKFASGLNLYYAVSNIASIPQQWLIAKERLKRQPKK